MTPSNSEPTDDYEELVSILNKHKVEYLIVGAYAVGYHGYIRATVDMDILVSSEPGNAVRLAAALYDFAAVTVDPGQIVEKTLIELGREPNSVHIITTITGVPWEAAWETRLKGKIGNQPAPFLSKECLIKNKRAMGRKKDSLDLNALGIKKRRPKK